MELHEQTWGAAWSVWRLPYQNRISHPGAVLGLPLQYEHIRCSQAAAATDDDIVQMYEGISVLVLTNKVWASIILPCGSNYF